MTTGRGISKQEKEPSHHATSKVRRLQCTIPRWITATVYYRLYSENVSFQICTTFFSRFFLERSLSKIVYDTYALPASSFLIHVKSVLFYARTPSCHLIGKKVNKWLSYVNIRNGKRRKRLGTKIRFWKCEPREYTKMKTIPLFQDFTPTLRLEF